LANTEKTKHQVIVYGWAQDGKELTVFEVQGGFLWPNFVFTAAVLSEVDLLVGLEPEAHVNVLLSSHVIPLKDGDCIFLKGLHITDCHGFDHLRSDSQQCSPHFSKNLPWEHTHVQKALKE
ncbi:hypothetical protein L208DRAFT_1195857, partial [Tricholoma matsutake]